MNQRWMTIAGVIFAVVLIFVFVGRHKNQEASNTGAPSSAEAKKLYDEAQNLESNGQKMEAKAAYQKMINDYPDFDQMETIQKHLGDLNIEVIASNTETPQTVIHEVAPGDSLAKISKEYTTTIELIKKSNGLKNDTIRAGQRLRIWKGKFDIFVDKSQNMLILKNLHRF